MLCAVAYSVSYLQIDLKFFWGSKKEVALPVWFILLKILSIFIKVYKGETGLKERESHDCLSLWLRYLTKD